MRIKLGDLPEIYRKQAQKAFNEDSASNSTPYNKSNSSNELVAKKEAEGFNGRISLSYHSKRKRLCDADALWTKYVTDSLVSCGVLQDDSAKFISQVRTSQEKSKINETIIEIYES